MKEHAERGKKDIKSGGEIKSTQRGKREKGSKSKQLEFGRDKDKAKTFYLQFYVFLSLINKIYDLYS